MFHNRLRPGSGLLAGWASEAAVVPVGVAETTQPAVMGRAAASSVRKALSRRGPVSAGRAVPLRRDRAGVSRLIRSVPCSMRCTGRPRPIPGGDSTRYMTRSAAGMSCGARGSRCAGITARRASTKITLADVEEYGVTRLLDEVASDVGGGSLPSAAGPAGTDTQAGDDGAVTALDSFGRDRIVQAAVKIVLEPIFEADILACSFRVPPATPTHDALQVLIDECWRGRRWVVETDIANCFSSDPASGFDARGAGTRQ